METPRRALRNIYLNDVQQISTPLKIPASPFLKTLGHGTGVSVYRLDRSPKFGKIRSPWAVKRVTSRTRADGRDQIFSARIQDEAEILRKLNHPNIVGFRAVTKDSQGVETLALECCNTSLGSILEERFEEDMGPLPAKYSLKMIKDIAKALDYLHTQAKILHGDLKSFNVLVKGDFEICKLCDFGVSIPLDEKGEIDFTKDPKVRYVGTNLWSAPEIMDDADIIDSKADIFSFGLVIYETIALTPPHMMAIEDLEEEEEDDDPKESSLDESKENSINSSCVSSFDEKYQGAYGTRPPLPQAFILTDEYIPIVEFFYCCTNSLAEDRPSAKAIWQSFKDN